MNQNIQNSVLKTLQQVLTHKKRPTSSVGVAGVSIHCRFSVVQWCSTFGLESGTTSFKSNSPNSTFALVLYDHLAKENIYSESEENYIAFMLYCSEDDFQHYTKPLMHMKCYMMSGQTSLVKQQPLLILCVWNPANTQATSSRKGIRSLLFF